MKKALVVRHDGAPFAVRMTKVLAAIVDSGFSCDIAVPSGHLATVNVGKEIDRDMMLETKVIELPCGEARKLYWGVLRAIGLPELWNPVFQKSLTDLLREKQYDLVLVKDTKSLPTVFKALRLSGSKAKVICDMYENATMQLRDGWYTYGTPLMRFRYIITGIERRIAKAERDYLPQCHKIFVVVEEARDFLVDRYHIPRSAIEVVHNVEWLGPFDRISAGVTRTENPIISYVGGIAAHRGIPDFLKALALVKAQANTSIEGLIVGVGASQRAAIAAEIEALGLSEEVRIVGFVSHVEAMRWIKKSSIGVVPHRDSPFIRTTIPNKLFQYMAAGVAQVANDIPPLNRIIEETGCGWVANTAKPQSFASALLKALENPDESARRGAQGRFWCESKYCWEVEGLRYSECFAALAQ